MFGKKKKKKIHIHCKFRFKKICFHLYILAGWSIIGWLNVILVQIEDYIVRKVNFLSYKFTRATWVGGKKKKKKSPDTVHL